MSARFGNDVREPKPLTRQSYGGAGLPEPLANQWEYLQDSARTVRWHTECPVYRQSVGEHTYGVQMLVLMLTNWEASRNLVIHALMHDTAERKFGDVPGPTKKLAGLKEAFDALEDDFMERMGLVIPELTPHEKYVLKMADLLEGAAFAAWEIRRGNKEMRDGFRNYLNYIATMDPIGVAEMMYNQLLKEYNDAFGQ
jgi:5'-deoxynucleotidase YfbR-like HD superfamily hydrolase